MSSATSNSPATRDVAALLLGAALSGFDGGAIGFVLPAMRHATGASAQQASWLLSVFVAGTLAAIACSGLVAARLGARRLFDGCIVLAALAAALAALAPNPPLLLAARLLQGLAQGPLMPLAAAIIAVSWPADRAGRIIGALSLVYGLAFLGAMIATPALLHAAGWRAAFVVSFVLSLAACLVLRRAPAHAVPGARAQTATFVAGALLNRTMVAIVLLSLGTGIGQAVLVWFPTLAIARLSVPTAQTSLLMLPLVVGGIGATVAITAVLDRTGARILLLAGALLTLAGVLLAAAAPASRFNFMLGAGLLGIGITSLCGGPLRYAAARAVPTTGQVLAQSAVALATNLGVLAGSVLLGALAGWGGDERAAIEAALLLACLPMALLFAPVVLLPLRRADPSTPPLEKHA